MSFSGSEGSSDELQLSQSEGDWDAWKRLFTVRLQFVVGAGSFATVGSFEEFVQPGVIVVGVGQIGLPLSSYEAKTLIKVSRQAPFGKGKNTLVDEAVRKTWEIDRSQVSFKNQAWQAWLDGVVQRVARELGVAAGEKSVKAELHKMLLYEEGAMFKPHKE